MKIVEINDKYINYLKMYFSNYLLDNKEDKRYHNRKYIGVVFKIDNLNYFAPLSSPKKSDFNSDGTIKKSTLALIRISYIYNNKLELLGKIKLNCMIPVPDNAIIDYDLNNELNKKYKDLIINEFLWLQRNETLVINSAEKLYKIKCNEDKYINDKNHKFYKSIIPFKAVEKLYNKYLEHNLQK